MKMRMMADATSLREALKTILMVVVRRNTIPVLGAVRVTAAAGEAWGTVSATDLDIGITCRFDAAEGDGFDCLIFPRYLAMLCDGEGGTVEIEITDDNTVRLRNSSADMTIATVIPVEDWPEMLFEPAGGEWAISEDALRTALERVRICISTEETRYYLNGIYLHRNVAGETYMVATDGHRLCRYAISDPWPFAATIWPRKAVGIIHHLLRSGGNEIVRVQARADALVARVEIGGTAITFKMIDGNFPDYTRAIPDGDPKIRMVLNEAALRRLGPPEGRNSTAVELDPEEGTLRRKFFNDDVSITVRTQKGEGKRVGFNIRHLRDFVRGEDAIRLESSGPADPAKVYGADPRCLRVLMPMRM